MKVLIIGGGAAGMMAAVTAAQAGAEVTIAEKNDRPGKKLFITGKGRCNLTNACEKQEFFEHILRNPRFLYSSFGKWNNWDMMAFVEEAGTPLKTERGNRVFPQSDKSSDVIRALTKTLEQYPVNWLFGAAAESLRIEGGAVTGAVIRQGGKVRTVPADAVIVAAGGRSYPATGSTGDGYALAKQAGHTIVPVMPSLVPLNAAFGEKIAACFHPADLMGLTLKNVTLRCFDGERLLAEEFGELLFTHFGLSGPAVLSASCLLGEVLYQERRPVRLEIDLKPALSLAQMEERFVREAPAAGAKQLSNTLGGWLPRALIPPVLALAGLPKEKKTAELTRAERTRLLESMKAFPMTALSFRGFEEAIVTRGGVNVKEIDPATMASRCCKGLFLAGEILDVDGYTGGFNLQIAWSTGAAAGRAAAKETTMKKTERSNRNIAIDGPAGSGKSTIAKNIAKETGLIYVDTGAMYRAMAIHFLRKGLQADDEAGIAAACESADVTIAYENGAQQVTLCGENVTPHLREEAVGNMASASSVYAPVRNKMTALQQKLAREKDVVMDGRDIGTVVLPDAYLKIFMTASVEVRAERRYKELLEKGQEADYETIRAEIVERDWRDSHREIAPLKQAEDAVLLDTSDLSIEEVTQKVLELYRKKG
ncbi:MAG: (d)CMP kinase [Lachnospiraceae bacterium]|nr:(d)CMP kinase [Lachnospiraceae bacterium]